MALKTWSLPTLPAQTVEDSQDPSLGWTVQYDKGPLVQAYAPWAPGHVFFRTADIHDPTDALGSSVSEDDGGLAAALYSYSYSWATSKGESAVGATDVTARIEGSTGQVTLTLPTRPDWADFTVVYRAEYRMKLIVPGYFYPDPNGSDWDTLTGSSPDGVLWAVVNDRSGALAGQTADANYTTLIGAARTAGLPMLFYVDTNYAARTLAEVKADMAFWVSLYGHPSGWFFDRASASPDDIGYYQDLYAYAAGGRVVLNHGTTPDELYLSGHAVCDTSIVFEDTATALESWTPPSFLASYTPDRFGVIVHDAADSDALTAAWSTITAQNIAWAFVTTSSSYAELPTYWATERALVTPGDEDTVYRRLGTSTDLEFIDDGTLPLGVPALTTPGGTAIHTEVNH